MARLEKVLEFCREPRTVKDISNYLFNSATDYHILLALEEAGAHVEYLYQRGRPTIHNLEDLEQKPNPVLYYCMR